MIKVDSRSRDRSQVSQFSIQWLISKPGGLLKHFS